MEDILDTIMQNPSNPEQKTVEKLLLMCNFFFFAIKCNYTN